MEYDKTKIQITHLYKLREMYCNNMYGKKLPVFSFLTLLQDRLGPQKKWT